MKKADLVNAVYNEYADGNDWEKALELITGSPHADLLADAVFDAANKRTIPQLKQLLAELKGVEKWKPPTKRFGGRGGSHNDM